MSDESTPFTLPPQLLGVRFLSEDGKLAFTVRHADPPDRPHFPLSVEVVAYTEGGPRVRIHDGLARFIPRQDEDAEHAGTRLDRIQIELGTPHVGPTYSLLLCRPTDDRSRWRGFDWVPLRADTPVEVMAAFPQYGGTPYGPDDWDWQEGWWYPYSTFHAADAPSPR